jgi:hypothetical protein
MNEYDINDSVTVKATFSVDEVDTDPSTIALAVTDPSGNVDNYTYAGGTVTKEATGIYKKAITVDESGEWVYTWTGAGSVIAAGSRRFSVRRAGA